MKKILLSALVLFFGLSACNPKKSDQLRTSQLPLPSDTVSFTPPKNIILMIGDGMGLTQITAGMYINGNKLNLEQFKYIGLHKSYASNDLVTDSAAGATALSCGIKTYNGAIGVNDAVMPVQTILEEADLAGLSTGLVATSSITHATPGSFFAHQKDRSMMEEIAADLLKVDLDFFVGGGLKHFTRRKDERDLVQELTNKGYVISNFVEQEIGDVKVDPGKKFGYFTADGEPLPFSQGRNYLVNATQAAVDYLSSPARSDKGFFLMVEGSQIDWGGHSNKADYLISEMIEFDQAIGTVLDFARKNGETLVIVTADHETGGFAINPGSKMDSIVPAFTTDQHTAALVPVFAWGPGQELFSGIYENTSIYNKMRKALGFSAIK
jgi:alkaline phosphatase